MIPIIGVIGTALQTIAAPIGEWLAGVTARRRIKEEGKVRVAIAQAEAEVELAKTTAEYDVEAQRQMQHSYKDEWWTLLYSMPFITTFMAPLIDAWNAPGDFIMTDAVLKSWKAVDAAPVWYWWIMIGMVASTFGLRWLVRRTSPLPGK